MLHLAESQLGPPPVDYAWVAAGSQARSEQTAKTDQDNALVVANFVDFDTLYGHRRDVAGYAAALEAFDRDLPRFLDALRPGDLAVLTADHGCDPTWRGSDHTREQVPVLFAGPGLPPGDLGQLAFSDVGATLAAHLGLPPGQHGIDRLGPGG